MSAVTPIAAQAPRMYYASMLKDPDEIIRRVWTALKSRSNVPFRHVKFSDGSSPQAHRCETDVLRWTSENPGFEPIHGWFAIGDPPLLLQKHWFVRDENGQFINITPLELPPPILEHPGSVAEFMYLPEEIHLVHHQHLRD